MRADLRRGVIAHSEEQYFDSQTQRDPLFYYKLSKDWVGVAWADNDAVLAGELAPDWAADYDGRTVTEKFVHARKEILCGPEPLGRKEAEIFFLYRAERNHRCTPQDTRHLLNEVAGILHSAVECTAVPDVYDYLESGARVGQKRRSRQARVRGAGLSVRRNDDESTSINSPWTSAQVAVSYERLRSGIRQVRTFVRDVRKCIDPKSKREWPTVEEVRRHLNGSYLATFADKWDLDFLIGLCMEASRCRENGLAHKLIARKLGVEVSSAVTYISRGKNQG